MRASELASVAFLFLGVQLLISFPAGALNAIWLVRTATQNPEIYGSVSAGLRVLLAFLVALTMAVGIAFIAFRKRLGDAAFPSPRPAEPMRVLETTDFVSVALAVAGVWLTVTALRDATPTIAEGLIRAWNPLYGPGETEPLLIWPKRAAFLFQLAAGLALFFGARGLARLWDGMRSAGGSERAV
jgi:hypothetical protein